MQDGEGKQNLLAEGMQRYLFEACPALAARCQAAIVGLPPFALQEIAGRLQTLIAVSNVTNRELTAARVAVTRGQAPAELLLDRALASIEDLSEVARAAMERLDEVLKA